MLLTNLLKHVGIKPVHLLLIHIVLKALLLVIQYTNFALAPGLSSAPGPSSAPEQTAGNALGRDGDGNGDGEGLSGDASDDDDAAGSMAGSDQSGGEVPRDRGYMFGPDDNGDIIEDEGHCFHEGEDETEANAMY